jgi:hypothetical protein
MRSLRWSRPSVIKDSIIGNIVIIDLWCNNYTHTSGDPAEIDQLGVRLLFVHRDVGQGDQLRHRAILILNVTQV